MRNLGFVLLAVTMATATTTSQTAVGTIQGRVHTTAGDPIPNASVGMILIGSLPPELADFMLTLPSNLQITPVILEEGGRIERESRSAGPSPQRSGFSATSDSGGRFVFNNVPPGKYSVQVRTPGYFAATPGGTPGSPGGFLTWLEVRGNEITEIAFSLVRGGIVSGRVSNSDGQPAPGINVAAFKREYAPDGRVLFTSQISRTTDDRGEYRLFDMATGEYRIGLPDPGFPRLRMPDDPNSAEGVVVKESAELRGVNITRSTRPTFRVSGTVTFLLPPGSTPANTRIGSFYLVPLDSRFFTDFDAPSLRNESTDPATFEIRGVSPGAYELISLATPTNDLRFIGRTLINVPMQDLNNVAITIRPNVEVRARLVYEKAVSPAGTREVRLLLKPKERYPAALDAVQSRGTSTVDATGAFVFTHVPQGRYSFEVSPLEPDAYISDIRENGRSVLDEGFVSGAAPVSVEVVVDPAGERVEGTVLDAEQKPVALERVVLVPELSRRQNLSLFKTALADASGRFAFRGVAPGTYKVFAWAPSSPANAHMNEEFMSKYEDFGHTIHVTKTFSGRLTVRAIQR